MTVHSAHPDSHTNGLDMDCPRCQQLAEHPEGLDRDNLRRLLTGRIYTVLDRYVAEKLKETISAGQRLADIRDEGFERVRGVVMGER
jgi:hypothetical protein